MPVAIKGSDGTVEAGVATVTVREGDLEYITGRIESVYRLGSENGKDISLTAYKLMHYPIYVDDEQQGSQRICMDIGEDVPVCKTLDTGGVEMDDMGKGMHYFVIGYDANTGMITVEA